MIAIYTEHTAQAGKRAWKVEQQHGPEVVDEDVQWHDATPASADQADRMAGALGGSTGQFYRRVAETIRECINAAEYQVIEDNGGGLHLYVFDAGGINGGKVIYAGTNFEYNVGSLRSALDALDAGESTHGWEDGMGGELGDPQAHYDAWDKWERGWEVVANGSHGKRQLLPANMGVAARLEFQIDENNL